MIKMTRLKQDRCPQRGQRKAWASFAIHARQSRLSTGLFSWSDVYVAGPEPGTAFTRRRLGTVARDSDMPLAAISSRAAGRQTRESVRNDPRRSADMPGLRDG